MTSHEFRSTPNLVTQFRKLLETPIMEMVLEAMDESENPMNKVAPPDITPHGAYIMLGEQTGWRQYRTRFMLMAQGIEPPQTDGEPTYADPPKETVEEN